MLGGLVTWSPESSAPTSTVSPCLARVPAAMVPTASLTAVWRSEPMLMPLSAEAPAANGSEAAERTDTSPVAA